MAAYRRIKTTATEIAITRDGITRSILRSSLPARPTATQVRNAIRTAFGVGTISDLFAHVNRDYSIAIATGVEPTVWPEDEPQL